MSDICPICGNRRDSYACLCNSFSAATGTLLTIMPTQQEYDAMQAEIARLKAELEKANDEIKNLTAAEINAVYWLDMAIEGRDEARKWARILFQMARKYKKICTEIDILAIESTAGSWNEPDILSEDVENG